MAFPKFKFCWDGSRVEADWHLGLFGVYTRGIAGGRLRGVVISGRGVLTWMGGLAVVAYFTGAAALWFWLDRRPYNYVTYADLILPTRWGEIQKLRGKAMIAEGMDDIKARRWGAGLQKLRIGIARNPEEIDGRLTLAEIFLAMKARKQAVETYDGGLAVRYPGRDYIETMLKMATQSEDFEWRLRTCNRALELIAGKTEYAKERKWLIQQKLAALLAGDRADEALALADAEGESGSPTISEFRVLALFEAGKPGDALVFLDEWTRRSGGRPDHQILRLRVRALRELGKPAEMDEALEALRSLSPTDPRPYVYAIVQYLLAERRAEAEAGLEHFLLRFGSTPSYLHLLAAPLAEIAERAMLEKLIAYARQQGFDLEPFHRFLVQALVAKGDWRAAAKVMAKIMDSPKKSEMVTQWDGLMKAQIDAALDAADGAQSNFVNLLRGRQFALGFYKNLITNMRRAGRPATAREIIVFAQGMYPQNTEIETWRKELDEELAAAEAAKPVIVMSRPSSASSPTVSPSAPAVARVELGEKEFFSKLDELSNAGDYEKALQSIREIRRDKPLWLSGREARIDREEVRLSGRAGDMLTLRSSVRLFNNGDRMRSAQLVEIAREFHSSGKNDEALYVLKELLARTPDYPVAQRLQAEWTAKAAPQAP
jgi:hypothetical protein